MAERTVPFSLERSRSWDPFADRHSRIFDQCFGMPALTEEALLTTHWPGYFRPSVLAPDLSPLMSLMHPGPALARQLSSGTSQIQQTKDSWKVSLDVQHFSPEELVVKTKDGVLEISGTHEEREDQHGFVSRKFTRKYTLPSSVDAEKVTSALSPEGVLTVQAPLVAPALEASKTTTAVTDDNKAAKKK
ncbi:unnamed protein product [Knipowitschia caucasica]|uniref:SHSP domain-containing protein n=1 Tax=Knipowitschia caucasica TaxID=637954 RepID=A0AAV2MG61_KNICA